MDNNIEIYIGKRLKQIRNIKGMNQTDLGGLVGVTFQQIQKYETGVNRISASRLYEFSKVFGVPITYFLADLETTKTPTESTEEALPNDYEILNRENLELISAYSGIKHETIRKRVLDLIKSVNNPTLGQ